MEIALCLGSNTGERLGYLQAARDALCGLPGVTLAVQSAVYETDPVGVRSQYADMLYLNAVLIVDAQIPADTLALSMHAIENRLGRVRCEDKNAPRTIDIDMLYAADIADANPALTLPHPRWDLRRFVVQPLADVRPHLTLPGHHKTVQQILHELPAIPGVRLYAATW